MFGTVASESFWCLLCYSAPQFIRFLVREHPGKSLENHFLAFILLKLQIFLTVFPPFLWKTRKHYLFFSTQLLELCEASTLNLFFRFFLFPFNFLHINSQNRAVCKCPISDPNWDKTGQSKLFVTILGLLQTSSNPQELACMGEEPEAKMRT